MKPNLFFKVHFLNVGGVYPPNEDLVINCKVNNPNFGRNCDYVMLMPNDFKDMNDYYNIAEARPNMYCDGILQFVFRCMCDFSYFLFSF